MIRNLYSICFWVFSLGLPLLAKNTGADLPTPSTSSKAGDKAVPSPQLALAASDAKAKEQILKKQQIIVTPDIARGEVSPTLLAKEEQEKTSLLKTSVRKAGGGATTSSLVTQNSPVVRDITHGAIFPAPVAKQDSSMPTVIKAAFHDAQLSTETLPVVTRDSSTVAHTDVVTPVRTASGPVTTESGPDNTPSGERLARVTAYWADEGDYYTERGISATGVRLHDGHCAVDPNIIPYGSVVEVTGVGKFLAVDTGSAVINRTAAREGGHTEAERHAIVIDLYFEDSSEGERFAAGAAKYVSVTWWTPSAMGTDAKAARSLFADENWTKIQSKQL